MCGNDFKPSLSVTCGPLGGPGKTWGRCIHAQYYKLDPMYKHVGFYDPVKRGTRDYKTAVLLLGHPSDEYVLY